MAQNPAGRPPADRQSRPGASSSGPDWAPVRRTRHRRAVAVIVALAMLLTVLGGTAVTIMTAFPASAHDQLVGSDPADGAELDEPVEQVTLSYSAEVLADGSMVTVVTPDGEVEADVTVDGTDVVADLGEQTAGGEYVVRWRVVSSDGHPIEGEVAYTVAAQPEPTPSEEPSEEPSEQASEPAAAASAEASQEAAADPEASPEASAEADGAGAMPLVYGAALVAIIGVALAVLVRSRRRLHDDVTRGDQQGPQD